MQWNRRKVEEAGIKGGGRGTGGESNGRRGNSGGRKKNEEAEEKRGSVLYDRKASVKGSSSDLERQWRWQRLH